MTYHLTYYIYIHQVNGVKLADIMFSLVCVCARARALSPIGMNGRNDVLFAEKCIRLLRENLRIFLYGQYIIGNVV